MLQVKTLALASLIAFSATQGYAQSQPEPSKQMAEFLSWDASAQNAYIGNGIVMIGVIAAQTQPEIARCIDTWYLGREENRRLRHNEALETMRKFPNYLPEAIILAVVEKACGKFSRAE
ncbi:MAG: hypothetical protein RIA09_10110 [Hoeflea sp.]|uniref:hypothetical protein n=1 Tax=Hoeflea sp. TaxID=1940281 RepID=UPI0032EBE3F8